jgi:hypothetical protein
MTYLEYEKLGYYDLKSKMIEYLQSRVTRLRENSLDTEFDYCEIAGRLAEIQAFSDFLKEESKRKIEEDNSKEKD